MIKTPGAGPASVGFMVEIVNRLHLEYGGYWEASPCVSVDRVNDMIGCGK